jgi:hypothetical protein
LIQKETDLFLRSKAYFPAEIIDLRCADHAIDALVSVLDLDNVARFRRDIDHKPARPVINLPSEDGTN